MPNFGPVVSNFSNTVDTEAPGALVYVGEVQEGNTLRYSFITPINDANGGSLTGLKNVNLAYAPLNQDGTSPFEGLSGAQIEAAFASTIVRTPVTDGVGGKSVDVLAPVLVAGNQQAWAAYASD